jgi:DNA modification methylase
MINNIFNDDCFNVFDKIDEKIINLVLVDLPYGQTGCKWDVVIDLKKMWDNLKRICKENCYYVFFTTTKYGFDIINSNKLWFRYDLVYFKHISVGFLNSNKMPLRSHEMIYIFYNTQRKKNNKMIYNPQKTIGKPYIKKDTKYKEGYIDIYGGKERQGLENKTGDRHPKSVLKFHQKDEKLHPTQKPLELCEWLIKTYSNEGDIVLDFCMGSGTTIKACINTKRNYIGIEKDEDIFNTAKERIERATLFT